jgi:predicted methyltransferase
MKTWALALLLALAACSRSSDPRATEPQPPEAPSVYLGRTIAQPMSYEGAGWLDREDRETSEKPEHVLDVLGIKDGDVVADVGAGSGYFTMRIAKRVPHGRVVATDLQPEMLGMIEKKIADLRITNVVTRRAAPRDANLPRHEIDLVLMVDVYHELPYPAETLAQVKTSLRPGGRIALVEYRAEDPEVAIKPEHKMTLAQIKKELDANGFAFVSSDESLPAQRIVVFTPRDRSP